MELQADYLYYRQGDAFDVLGHAANMGPARDVGFGMAILDPQGTLRYLPFWSTDYTVMQLAVPANFHVRDLLLVHTILQPNSGPFTTGGNYYIFSGLVDPGTGQLLCDLCVTGFEVDM